MFEFLALMLMLFLGVSVVVGLLKLLVVAILIPVKIALWMTKGVLLLFVGIPLAIIAVCFFSGVFPILFFALMLPILLLAAGTGAVAKLIFA